MPAPLGSETRAKTKTTMSILPPPRKNSTIKSPASEIAQLHGEILAAAKTSLDKAIRIGKLLADQKSKLAHGEWLPWLESNVPFTSRTATNYMRVWSERDRLKSESLSDLDSAYRLLAPPPAATRLADSESKIAAGLPVANDVLAALAEIRDSKLYRCDYGTFEEYVAAKFGEEFAKSILLEGW